MKHPLILVNLILVIALAGCGGGTSHDTPSLSDKSTEVGAIQIRFMRAPSQSAARAAPIVLNEPSTVRIVIDNPTTGFRVVEDYPVPATVEAYVPVAVGQGYKVRAFSFVGDPIYVSERLLLKYGSKDGISVVSNQTTDVSLVLDPITAGVTYPASATGGDLLNVTLAEHPALRNHGWIFAKTTEIDASRTGIVGYVEFAASAIRTDGTTIVSFNAPNVSTPSKLYLLSERFLTNELIKTGEDGSHFHLYSPNVNHGADQVFLTLAPPVGGIGVTVTY